MDDSLYLKHYGVVGMKWGVRRYQNYDGTKIGSEIATKHFTKATKKVEGYNKAANKKYAKYSKLDKKAAKSEKKASTIARKKLGRPRINEANSIATEARSKANFAYTKYKAIDAKRTKWIQQMEKAFSKVYYSDVSKEAIARGKKYSYMLIQ